MDFEGRGVRLVLAVTAAVALVALAARGDHGGPGSSALSFPSSVTATTEAVVLIVLGLLAIGVWLLIVSSLPGPRGARPPRSPARMLARVVIFAACVLLFSWVRPHDGAPSAPDARRSRDVSAGSPSGQPDGDRATTPAWGLGGVGVIALLAAGGAVLWARRDNSAPLSRQAMVVATAEEQEGAIARAIECADPREAVLLAFAAAEALLSVDATTRRPLSRSAREWSRDVGLPPLDAIVSRYELARFSRHEVTEADRVIALDALATMA